jgi:hypothetical protein
MVPPFIGHGADIDLATEQLNEAGMTHIIDATAPSVKAVPSGERSQVAELDASKLIYTRNTNPKAVPEPNSPEVWQMSSYVVAHPFPPPPTKEKQSVPKHTRAL